MDIKNILNLLNKVRPSFSVYERRPGKYQLTVPILHEDGDMVDIYLQESPKGAGYVRICDFGMAGQRLSYNYELNTISKKKIFNSILFNNGVQNENGNLYLDALVDKIYESVFQFAGCVQKVCSMDYWSKEMIQSTFYEDLQSFIVKGLEEFNPQPDVTPLSDNKIKNNQDKQATSLFKVDWSLSWKKRKFYVFGILGKNKVKDTTIALLEFKKAELSFMSLAVHEDMQSLGDKELIYLTRNSDKQYPALSDFSETGVADIKRLAS